MAENVSRLTADRRRRARLARAGRDQAMLREVRDLMLRGREQQQRLQRLERMERAARVWVNGRALGAQPPHGQLHESYD